MTSALSFIRSVPNPIKSVFSFFLLCSVSGCGDSGPPKVDVFPVSGTVKGEGDLTGCLITFNAVDPNGVSGSGTIEPGGKYTLEALDGRPGCSAGSFKVTLTISQEATKQAMMKAMSTKMGAGKSGPPKIEGPFPQKYSTIDTSDKSVEVKPETNTIDITL